MRDSARVPNIQVGGDIMQRIISMAALVCILSAGRALAQVNSSVGGLVHDPSKALIPGVTITATNTQTGVVSTTLSNESGAYNFPAIVPGIQRRRLRVSHKREDRDAVVPGAITPDVLELP